MQAIRHRGACIARQARTAALRQAPRRHASDHHHAEPVNETIGLGFWGAFAAIPFSVVVYNLAQPGKDGEAAWLTRKIHEYHSWQEEWANRSALHTKAIEQAGFDRALFLHADVNRSVDVRYPEAIEHHAVRNVQAGSIANVDHIVAHYRQKHLDQEAAKASKSS